MLGLCTLKPCWLLYTATRTSKHEANALRTASSSFAIVTPRMVSYPPAKEEPARSSSGDDERTANRTLSFPAAHFFAASSTSFFCSASKVSFDVSALRSSQAFCNAAPVPSVTFENLSHEGVFFNSSNQLSKNATGRTNPGGTGNFASAMRINECALPPTSLKGAVVPGN